MSCIIVSQINFCESWYPFFHRNFSWENNFQYKQILAVLLLYWSFIGRLYTFIHLCQAGYTTCSMFLLNRASNYDVIKIVYDNVCCFLISFTGHFQCVAMSLCTSPSLSDCDGLKCVRFVTSILLSIIRLKTWKACYYHNNKPFIGVRVHQTSPERMHNFFSDFNCSKVTCLVSGPQPKVQENKGMPSITHALHYSFSQTTKISHS